MDDIVKDVNEGYDGSDPTGSPSIQYGFFNSLFFPLADLVQIQG